MGSEIFATVGPRLVLDSEANCFRALRRPKQQTIRKLIMQPRARPGKRPTRTASMGN